MKMLLKIPFPVKIIVVLTLFITPILYLHINRNIDKVQQFKPWLPEKYTLVSEDFFTNAVWIPFPFYQQLAGKEPNQKITILGRNTIGYLATVNNCDVYSTTRLYSQGRYPAMAIIESAEFKDGVVITKVALDKFPLLVFPPLLMALLICLYTMISATCRMREQHKEMFQIPV